MCTQVNFPALSERAPCDSCHKFFSLEIESQVKDSFTQKTPCCLLLCLSFLRGLFCAARPLAIWEYPAVQTTTRRKKNPSFICLIKRWIKQQWEYCRSKKGEDDQISCTFAFSWQRLSFLHARITGNVPGSRPRCRVCVISPRTHHRTNGSSRPRDFPPRQGQESHLAVPRGVPKHQVRVYEYAKNT